MKFESIKIENMLSFDKCKFQFKDYNVIVGPNNTGKTNLLRILKTVILSDGLSGLQIPEEMKLDRSKKSKIEIVVRMSNEETRLLLECITDKPIQPQEFDEELKHTTMILNWTDLVRKASIPNNVIFCFGNGMTVTTYFDKMIMFNWRHLSEDRDQFLKSLECLEYDQIHNKIKERLDVCPKNGVLADRVIDSEAINSMLTYQSRNCYAQLPSAIKYKSANPTPHASELRNYLGYEIGYNTISLSSFVSHMLERSFTYVEEIRPDYQKLTDDLFQLKMSNENAYKLIQETFEKIFQKTKMKVEQSNEHEGSKNIWIMEGAQKFKIKESASGHFAIIHILYNILDKQNKVIMLDEPEVHFHPVKIRLMGQELLNLIKSSQNQVIVISHSSEFVDFRLLDPAYPSSLISVAKQEMLSVVSQPRDLDINLGPHLFKPEIFFGSMVFLVEGADDEFVMRAISDSLDGMFDRYGIVLVNCWGHPNIDPYTKLLDAYSIQYAGLADDEYSGNSSSIVKLDKDLEAELGKTGWIGSRSSLKPDIAYCLITELLETKKGLDKIRDTRIWCCIESIAKLLDIDMKSLIDKYN